MAQVMKEAAPAPKMKDGRQAETEAADRISMATQWQLMWWRFRKHRVAVASGLILIGFYIVVIFAEFFAYAEPSKSEAERSLLPPPTDPFLRRGHIQTPCLRPDRQTGPQDI